MLGRVLAGGLYLVGVPLLFPPVWPWTYTGLNLVLFLVASVVVGFIVGKWALVLPWVLVIALVVGIAIYIEYINSTSADVRIESSLTAFAFALPNGLAALVADLAIALGILIRKGRGGRFASRFARAS